MSVTFRPFAMADIAALQRWFQTEEDVLQWAGASMSYPVRTADLKAIVRAHRKRDGQLEAWSMYRGDGQLCGHAQLWFDPRLHQATLGRVAIAPELRGQGLAALLIQDAVTRGFAPAWVNRLELRVYTHNAPAIAAYTRIGFSHEGTRRQSTPISQTYWDTAVMSLLREEYERFDKRTERE